MKAVIAKYVLVEGEKGEQDDWSFFISFKQRWFKTSEAKILIEKALEIGLLKEEEGFLSPTFDVRGLDLPGMFTPSKNLISELSVVDPSNGQCHCGEKILLDRIISRIMENTKKSEDVLTKEILNIKEETGFTAETAALFTASKYGLDITDFVEEVRRILEP